MATVMTDEQPRQKVTMCSWVMFCTNPAMAHVHKRMPSTGKILEDDVCSRHKHDAEHAGFTYGFPEPDDNEDRQGVEGG